MKEILMFARFGKASWAGPVLGVMLLSGCSFFNGDDPETPSSQATRFYLDDVDSEECIATEPLVAPDGWIYYPVLYTDEQGQQYLLVHDPDAAIVAMEGDYVDRGEDTMVCQTQDDVDAIKAEREAAHLADLVASDKACRLNSDEVALYRDGEYADQDIQGYCLSAREADADNQLTDELIALIATAANQDNWADQASAVVTLYCDLREDDVHPVMAVNLERLDQAWKAGYEAGRVYTPNYPSEFNDAVRDWCGSSSTTHSPYRPYDNNELPPEPPSDMTLNG